MKMKNLIYIPLVTLILWSCTNEPEKPSTISVQEIADDFELAKAHYMNMMKALPEDKFPRSFENGSFTTSGSDWWCSGFYPGSLLFLYQETKDQGVLNEANRMLALLEKEQYNTGTHDLGFMMFCSFGYANWLNPSPQYDSILVQSAKSLSSRFSESTGCIRSWDSDSTDFIVIIDNMMNLELLFWATEKTGDSTYYDIAVTHANTTLQNHFREDNSSYHVLNYHPTTGEVQEKKTAQGLANESAWARGQAWGLYGYTATYRATKDPTYLNQAEKIADFILNHPNLPADMVPLWDFNTDPDDYRDASAAAIMASGLIELHQYLPNKGYLTAAKNILTSLHNDYLAELGTNGNFLIKHCVGHKPANSEVDVPLTYADYYYLEAIKRLKPLL